LDVRAWWGGLVDGMRDVSGQMYMRNRYYDPATGQFTQQDPIGLAGGLNSYGFAAGDPVSYSDPYGLCPWCLACAAGALSDVAIGYGVSRAVGARYSPRDVIAGVAAGCAGGMIGQVAAARHLRHLRHARHIDEAAEAARIAGIASRARSPLLQVQSAAREVGELGLGQGQGMEVLKQSITRMGLEYGDDVTIDGTRYLTLVHSPPRKHCLGTAIGRAGTDFRGYCCRFLA
jgi:RHS repeat-associated protein